jgi:hypothetical protein
METAKQENWSRECGKERKHSRTDFKAAGMLRHPTYDRSTSYQCMRVYCFGLRRFDAQRENTKPWWRSGVFIGRAILNGALLILPVTQKVHFCAARHSIKNVIRRLAYHDEVCETVLAWMRLKFSRS